jgi:NDP-sugar pyrophosphorylase family protein
MINIAKGFKYITIVLLYMRTRISMTIDKDLLKKLDSTIDGIKIRSRSNALETIIRQNFSDRNVAVILAGGDTNGLKLGNTFRPLLDIGGKTLIEDMIEKSKKSDFNNIVIVGQPKILSEIFKVVGNGKDLGVTVKYVEEEVALGSAKTLELAKPFVNSTFLFMPCDHYFDFDIKQMLRFHKTQGDTVTLGVYAQTDFNWNTSVVQIDGHKIVDYEEHAKKPKSHLRGIMVGFAEPSVMNYIPNGNMRCSLQENVFQDLVKERKISAFLISGHWVNVHEEKDVALIRKLRKKDKL